MSDVLVRHLLLAVFFPSCTRWFFTCTEFAMLYPAPRHNDIESNTNSVQITSKGIRQNIHQLIFQRTLSIYWKPSCRVGKHFRPTQDARAFHSQIPFSVKSAVSSNFHHFSPCLSNNLTNFKTKAYRLAGGIRANLRNHSH